MEYGDRLFSFSQPRVIFGVMISLGLLIYAFKKRRSNPLIFFSILWFFIALLPVSNLYPINAYMAEHWLYLPSVGYFLILANGLSLLHRSNRLRLVAFGLLVGIILFYSHLTIKQNNYWKDPIVFYQRTLRYAPGSFRLYHNLGKAYSEVGKNKEAINAYQQSVAINPRNAAAYNAMGSVYRVMGDMVNSIEFYKKAIAINPKFSDAYYNLGNAYISIGNKDEAIALYEKAIEVGAGHAHLGFYYNNLATIYALNGKIEEAIELYKKALKVDPGNVILLDNLRKLYKLTGNN
jgi:tetratricopeptide (TPR) repeat protein